ncbi:MULTISPECIES: molecular chaperone DnaJ [Haloferax]|uniref:molecular chaperone DnaJ n=1 Tax=Haloferax TaxID=2251 RepID=UPI002B40D544|nr:molecular chaperone DnaJ [Haloferax marinum]
MAYFAGLGRYLTGEGAAFVSALVSIDTAAPVPAALATSPLSLPSVATLQTAASAAPSALILPGTAAVLAVSLVVIVARFGHSWTTWLYALAALVPVVVLAAGALGIARPLVVDVVGLVVCPLLGAGGFVVDAGRYLFATR